MFEFDENGQALNFIYNNEIQEKLPMKDQNAFKRLKMHFSVPPHEIFNRIFSSLLPPILTKMYQRIYVDLFGPMLAVVLLTGILTYGYSLKVKSESLISPSQFLLAYSVAMPFVSYVLVRLAQSEMSFVELSSVLGYSLYGHILTLLLSFYLDDGVNNYFFFASLMIFGGLSTLRVAMIFIATIPKPALRLVICSFVGTVQLLFLLFVHFAYMHKTFVYGVVVNNVDDV